MKKQLSKDHPANSIVRLVNELHYQFPMSMICPLGLVRINDVTALRQRIDQQPGNPSHSPRLYDDPPSHTHKDYHNTYIAFLVPDEMKKEFTQAVGNLYHGSTIPKPTPLCASLSLRNNGGDEVERLPHSIIYVNVSNFLEKPTQFSTLLTTVNTRDNYKFGLKAAAGLASIGLMADATRRVIMNDLYQSPDPLTGGSTPVTGIGEFALGASIGIPASIMLVNNSDSLTHILPDLMGCGNPTTHEAHMPAFRTHLAEQFGLNIKDILDSDTRIYNIPKGI